MNHDDNDVKWGRRLGFFLGAANLVTGILNLWKHDWFIALACFIWVGNSLALCKHARYQQNFRDRVRLVDAAIHGMREQEER